ncbi:hypothetical protein V499_04084 [Pseudogymnoascus sp. VKM F-103]|nr:hypothetical protein V499_04084 [Pseudogymnoascus sp. VKM F-103]
MQPVSTHPEAQHAAEHSKVHETTPIQHHLRNHRHIFLVIGPAGCGKSTVADYVAAALDIPCIEGDSFHAETNVSKMRSGIALTDSDRWDWLVALREESISCLDKGTQGVVVTCSALKRKYRDVMRVAAYHHPSIMIHFIYLDAPVEILLHRVGLRRNHYMGADMVASQFDILERPSENEEDIISIDGSRRLEEVKVDALTRVRQLLRVI